MEISILYLYNILFYIYNHLTRGGFAHVAEDLVDQLQGFEGRVVECKKDSANKYYFYFDNGQVWKQRANARIPPGKCDFNVTITEDTFGYKMQIEGETKKIRIGRVR